MSRKLLRILFIPAIVAVCNLSLSTCSAGQQPKKIFYINSYHDGYPSSDDIRDGIKEEFENRNIALEIFYMDTKRNPDPEKISVKVEEARELVESNKPDLIIVSDDNAVGKLVVPYLQETGLPIVFCGVNWSAEKYKLGSQVTGMLEVLPLRECILTIKAVNPDTRRISVLSENTQSERNNTQLLDTLYKNLNMVVEYRMVDDFEQWMDAFSDLSTSCDLIYMPTNGAIRNWNKEEAILFVTENLKVPTITCDDFMMDYCVFGLTKLAKEQGEWAAKTAIKILDGQNPDTIPYAKNSRFQAYLNQKLADALGFSLSEEWKGAYTLFE